MKLECKPISQEEIFMKCYYDLFQHMFQHQIDNRFFKKKQKQTNLQIWHFSTTGIFEASVISRARVPNPWPVAHYWVVAGLEVGCVSSWPVHACMHSSTHALSELACTCTQVPTHCLHRPVPLSHPMPSCTIKCSICVQEDNFLFVWWSGEADTCCLQGKP